MAIYCFALFCRHMQRHAYFPPPIDNYLAIAELPPFICSKKIYLNILVALGSHYSIE